MPNTTESRLTNYEIEQVTQAAREAAVSIKRAMAIVDPLHPADPRLRHAAQVFIETYAKEFGVPEERARAGFAGLEDAMSFELATRWQDS
jgi:hypothetical protein